ncbi:chorismate--pyruvate lyase family protein [Kushneria aurantia]|uniref:Chorismate--pyruvate lyase family protein n=1 Tax=Kushneria aurantia TaxID=504092 RepID=A0ABV6G0M7_9GAMM|nr:chorismate lyase [Kushneria aurantia]
MPMDAVTLPPRWYPVALYRGALPASLIRSRDSLTARLESVAGATIRVRIHAQGVARGRPDELAALGLAAGRLVWRREVTLEAEGRTLVAARSVAALDDRSPWLAGIGNRALGHQLFSHRLRGAGKSRVTRSAIEATHARPGFAGLPALPARRSLFTLPGARQLLVQEYFSSALTDSAEAPPSVRLGACDRQEP